MKRPLPPKNADRAGQSDAFAAYLVRWNLLPDGEPIITHSSRLLPVLRCADGSPAMLKIADAVEEKSGGRLMAWWNGQGAARVLAFDDDAVLLERAEGILSLAEMAQTGRDDEASRVLCRVAARLHEPRHAPPPLVPLEHWFRELEPSAKQYDGVLRHSADTARELFADPQEVTVLHGDLHHGNVLDFGPRGWQAIDPKGLHGERGFDFANLFCNPDFATATTPGRLAQQVSVVTAETGLPRKRLLQWILAYAGLSAAWTLRDGSIPEVTLAVAEIAAAELQSLSGSGSQAVE